MLDTSGALGFAADRADRGALAADDRLGDSFGLAGLVAWAICAVGLVIAMFALVTGQMWLAMIGLSVAVMGPSLGLAWAWVAQRGAYNVALPSDD